MRALIHQGAGTSSGCEGESCTWTGSELDVPRGLGLPRVSGIHKAGNIIGDYIRQVNTSDKGKNIVERSCFHDGTYIWLGAEVAVCDDAFESIDIVTCYLELEKKTVELGLG